MRPFGHRVPDWPPLAGLVALVGALLGVACALPAAGVLVPAAGCPVVSVALGAVPALQGTGAARRPQLRGSAA